MRTEIDAAIAMAADMAADMAANDAETAPSQPPDDEPADETAERRETEFLAVISHELRSPLAAIKGYAATLRRHGQKIGRAEREEFLLAIDEASNRLEVLIARLLLLSRLEAGTVNLALSPVDVPRLVDETIAAVEHHWRPGMPEARQHILVAPQQSAMPLLQADLRLLREALDVVLEIAISSAPAGGAIHVAVESNGESLSLSVRDGGMGRDAAQLERIIQDLSQPDAQPYAHSARHLARDVAHAGVGLAICQRILALHGGKLWAESEPGGGSTAVMTLPLVPQTTTANETDDSDGPDTSDEHPMRNSR